MAEAPRLAVKAPWMGHADPRKWDDFHYVFRVNTLGFKDDKPKLLVELARCIDDKVCLDMKHSGFDLLVKTYDEVVTHLAKTFAAPKRSASVAFQLLGSITCKPGMNGHDWASEITSLARDAGISEEKIVVGNYLRGLPPMVSAILSVLPDFAAKPMVEVIPIVHSALEAHYRAHPDGSASPSVHAVTRDHSTAARRQHHRDNWQGRDRSFSPRPKNGRNAARRGSPAHSSIPTKDRGPKVNGRCKYCNIKGHLAAYCFKRARDEEDNNSDLSEGSNLAVTDAKRNILAITGSINNRPMTLFADSCASDSFISYKFVDPSDGPLQPSSLSSHAANGSKMSILGCLPMTVKVGDTAHTILMHVSDTFLHPALLGLSDMSRFGMVLNTRSRTVTLESGVTVTASAVTRSSSQLSFAKVPQVVNFGRRDPPAGLKVNATESPSPSGCSHVPRSQVLSPSIPRVPTLRVRNEIDLGDPSFNPQPPVARSVDDGLAHLDYTTKVSAKVSAEQSSELAGLIAKHPLLFSAEGYNLRLANVAPMHIELVEGARPVKIPAKTMNERDRRFAGAQIAEWAKAGVVVPSSSPWQTGAQVAYNGSKPRLVLNYIGLNRVTLFKPHPLPLLEEFRRRIGSSTVVFSKLDLKSGFILLPLHVDSQDYTTFVDPDGCRWKFTRVPFGLMCSPTHFQEVMDLLLAGVGGVHVYLDDILVFSKTVTDHLATLATVFRKLDAAGLLLNSDKCHFLMSSVPYLGNVVSTEGHRPDPDRVRAVSTLPFPATSADLKSFFGVAEMLRPFICNYGLIKGDLLPLLAKGAPFLPTTVQHEAFDRLKLAIVSAVLLYNPDMTRTFYLRTDFSDRGLGAVLYQLDDDNRIRVVQFLSRALHGAEKNYPPQKGEFLAVKWATSVLQHWLVGHPDVVIITDHQSLQYCMSDTQKEAAIRRWAASLRLIKPRFIYKTGASNVVADFLSRHSLSHDAYGPVEVDDESGGSSPQRVVGTPIVRESIAAIGEDSSSPPSKPSWLDLPHLASLQAKDSACRHIRASPLAAARRVSSRGVLKFHVDPGTDILLADLSSGASYRTVIVAPVSIVEEIIRHIHNKAHFRVAKTIKAVAAEFYWHSLRPDVTRLLADCIPCAERDPAPRSSLPTGQLRAFRPNQLVSTDVMGPLPLTATGNSFVITFSCIFTRYTVAVAIQDQTAATISRAFIEHWVAYFGPPEHLLSDNGTNYSSALFAEVCKLLLIHRIFTTPYHPQGDAVSERFNQTLQRAISKLTTDASRWDLHLPLACAAYNATISSATRVSPFTAMLGRDPPALISLPVGEDNLPSLSEFAAAANQVQLAAAKEINKEFDVKAAAIVSRNKSITPPFKVDDVVMMHDPVVPPGPGGKKFFRPYSRSFRILEVRSPNTALVVSTDKHARQGPRRVHFDRLKLAPPSLQLRQVSVDSPPPSVVHSDHCASESTTPPVPTDIAVPQVARASSSGRAIRSPSRYRNDD